MIALNYTQHTQCVHRSTSSSSTRLFSCFLSIWPPSSRMHLFFCWRFQEFIAIHIFDSFFILTFFKKFASVFFEGFHFHAFNTEAFQALIILSVRTRFCTLSPGISCLKHKFWRSMNKMDSVMG